MANLTNYPLGYDRDLDFVEILLIPVKPLESAIITDPAKFKSAMDSRFIPRTLIPRLAS